MPLDFKNNTKNFKTTSLAMSVFPRIYTNWQSEGYFQFCFEVWRPVISTIVDSYISFYKKWEIITGTFDSWKIQNVSIFYLLEFYITYFEISLTASADRL